MISKSQFLVPLFEKFISDSQKGKRIKPDGSRIKLQTIINYDYTLKYLKEFEEFKDQKLEIKLGKAKKISYSKQQPKEWLKFYNSFSDFLFKQKGFYDNYVGSIVKNIKAFFNYLKKDMGFDIGDHYKKFYVRKENIPILALQPNQLKFLIGDVSFHESLPKTIQKSKHVFVFGCTVALRVSDIFALKSTNIEYTGNGCYLRVKTKKTGKEVCLKLPDYAVTILQEFLSKGKGRKSIFPNIPLSRFNNHIKIIAEKAGWTQEIGKFRSKKGVAIAVFNDKTVRFCDLVSSHVMRRTAITTMLMLGMKEHIVRMISGHSSNSQSFFRYVNFVQSYVDVETDKVFNLLANDEQGRS